MEARNTFSVLGLLDGDATIGALRAALRGAHPTALGLPSSRVGAASSARGLPSARVGASSSAILGLPTALPGASSSSNRGKDVSSEVEDRHFGHTVDPALLLDPADTEGGWTKVAKFRAPRAVAPRPAPVIPAASEPEDELEEIRGGPGLRAPRMRDITKWILVTAVSRAGLCGRSYGHQI